MKCTLEKGNLHGIISLQESMSWILVHCYMHSGTTSKFSQQFKDRQGGVKGPLSCKDNWENGRQHKTEIGWEDRGLRLIYILHCKYGDFFPLNPEVVPYIIGKIQTICL